MIIFFENGRLGNQLFQYYGLRYCYPRHKLFFFGCQDLQNHLKFVKAFFIFPNVSSSTILFKVLKNIVNALVFLRVFSRITEKCDQNSFRLSLRKGLISGICVPQDVYFQHSDIVRMIEAAEVVPCLRDTLLERANNWITDKIECLGHSSLVFVHIRRGDYANWPTRQHPAILSLSWYKDAIRYLQYHVKDPVFILMSDDYYYLYDVFDESAKFLISDNSPEIDLALMSLCHSGILSASSFSWWGSLFARSNHEDEGIFVAPQFWAGHRLKQWYPEGFNSSWLTYQ